MAKMMPPLAVPSNLVMVMPLTLTALLNSSAWRKAFWPMLASRTSITSCGAVSSNFLITRVIFFSSSMRLDWVCSRPAVSAMTTSQSLALADCTASKMTDALSAPWCCAMTGMLLRSPQICSCSVAAARNVSPAANTTLCP